MKKVVNKKRAGRRLGSGVESLEPTIREGRDEGRYWTSHQLNVTTVKR